MMLKYLLNLRTRSKVCDGNSLNFFLSAIFYKLVYNKNILCHQKVIIKGVENIKTTNELKIGVDYIGFCSHKDITYLNINGKISFKGNYSIGRGCRFDI